MLTVLFATRDRVEIVRRVLEAYCLLDAPATGWKLVVVDNGSLDGTRETVSSFSGRLPLHLVTEPNPGKTNALNAGLRSIEGDLVVFTDDDAFPHGDWLIRLRTAADSHLEFSIFGGAILPRWEATPPNWVEWAEQGPVFTLTDPSWTEGSIPPNLVFGPNMAVRASVFHSGVRFDPFIGPRGSDYPMGSETELLLRLAGQGHQAYFVRDAVTEHLIRREQLEKVWIWKRATRYGRGFYQLYYAERRVFDGKLWLGIPRYLYRDIPRELLLALRAWVCGKQKAYFKSRWKFSFLRGQAIAARQIASSRKMFERRLSPPQSGRNAGSTTI